VEIKEILPADNQKLDEIKGQVISDYQTQLDMQWVNELRSKYQVDIHEKELEKVYENYHN
jgi:peptidyl-prolyl cis-trans isomerase SurA